MLYLPQPSQTDLLNFYNLIKDKIVKNLNNCTLNQDAKDYLTKEKIKELIISEPKKLLDFHNNIIPKLGLGFTVKNYNKYCKIKKIPLANRTHPEIYLHDLYKPEINKLATVFNYGDFISGHKITSYSLSRILNQSTCTYCNRLYTSTVIVKDEITGRVNDSTRLTRPTFDHWYSQSKFPILALSFYNLIPSCSVCNSSIKGTTEFSLTKFTHPYRKEVNQNFKFDYISESVHTNNVIIKSVSKSKISKTLKEFKIAEIYNAHSEFELKDLLELRYKYSENYLDTLFNKTFKVEVGKHEAYRMIFGTEYEERDFYKRPFSKFKKDILEKLDIKI